MTLSPSSLAPQHPKDRLLLTQFIPSFAKEETLMIVKVGPEWLDQKVGWSSLQISAAGVSIGFPGPLQSWKSPHSRPPPENTKDLLLCHLSQLTSRRCRASSGTGCPDAMLSVNQLMSSRAGCGWPGRGVSMFFSQQMASLAEVPSITTCVTSELEGEENETQGLCCSASVPSLCPCTVTGLPAIFQKAFPAPPR